MKVKRVTVHGFKSYEDTVSFGPFSPGKNALVGLNGTGKSNFYSAIGFVLLDEFAHLRVSDRKALLHEGQGRNAMTAFVEVVFDNTSRFFPSDKDEVSIRRSIGLKKDEYFVDRKNSTRQDVHNLLESCGFSPSSGYYIVRQGRINALAVMKDAERLDLLMEIAGTKFYDKQREESMRMIEESRGRTEKIKESIAYIENRLTQLESERKELELYEKLDRERRACEYLIQELHVRDLERDLEYIEGEHQSIAEAIENERTESQSAKKQIREVAEMLSDHKDREHAMIMEKNQAEKKKEKAIKSKTSAEYKKKGLETKLENADNTKVRAEAKLETVEQTISEKKELLSQVNTSYNQVADEKASADSELEALKQMHGGVVVDSKFIHGIECELEKARVLSDNIRARKEKVEQELADEQATREEATRNQELIATQLSDKHTEQKDEERRRNELLNERKKLWRDEAHCERKHKKKLATIEHIQGKIAAGMPKAVAMGLEAMKKMNIDGVYGCLYEVMRCEEEFDVAVNVVGRGRFYEVVVDTDKTAERIINELNKSKSGRLSFLVLNLLDRKEVTMPDGVVPLISKISYQDEEVAPAIHAVFGKVAIAGDLETATNIATMERISCVTVEGDFVSKRGPLTGGSRNHSKSPMALTAALGRNVADAEELKGELENIRSQIKELDNEIESVTRNINQSEKAIAELESHHMDAKATICAKTDAVDEKQKELGKVARKLENAERNVMAIETRLESIHRFNSEAGEGTIETITSLTAKSEDLDAQMKQLLDQRIVLRDEIENKLIPKRRRLIDEISRLNVETLAREISSAENDIEMAQANLEEAEGHLAYLEQGLVSISKEITDAERELSEMRGREMSRQAHIQRLKSELEAVVSRKSITKQRQDDCLKQQKEIGQWPAEEVEERSGMTSSELKRQHRGIIEEQNSYRHVNKKAYEQYRQFSERQEELQRRQNEIEESDRSIEALIRTLDQRKDEAIVSTFHRVSENFKEIFQELEPAARAELVLERDEEKGEYAGISIHTQFGDQAEVTSLAQLSGGQKALVALTLVFAIQRFAPAPFYLFDEVDSALDDKYRTAVSALMDRYCHPEDGTDPAQIIFTTFKPELLDNCDKYFGIKFDRGHSMALEITSEDAEKIVTEQGDGDE